MKRLLIASLAMAALATSVVAVSYTTITNYRGQVIQVPVQEVGGRVVQPFEQAPRIVALEVDRLLVNDALVSSGTTLFVRDPTKDLDKQTGGEIIIAGTNLVFNIVATNGVVLADPIPVVLKTGIFD